MIDDVLNDIRQAEEKAERMQKQAYQRGKEIVLNAEAEAEAQKKATVAECKEDRARILQNARAKADEKTKAILKKGSEDAEYLIAEKAPVIEECADKVVAILLSKYFGEEEQQG